jgi:hypothetical protein
MQVDRLMILGYNVRRRNPEKKPVFFEKTGF